MAAAVALGLAFGVRTSAAPEAVTLVEEMPGRAALLEARAAEAEETGTAGAPRFPVRGEIGESDAAVLFPTLRRGRDVYDPRTYFRRPPGLDFEVRAPEHPDEGWRVVTNELGLRQDWELSSEPPDLRVLVVGDSQTSGVCPYPESFPGRLHARLAGERPNRRVEVVNGGKGAWTFHNYLGLVETMLEHEPDVVVVVSYAGNDYVEALLLHHYLARTAPPEHSAGYRERVRRAVRRTNGAIAHSLQQAHYFADHPDEVEVALGSALAVTDEILAVCRAEGIAPIFVNVPSPFDAQPRIYAEHARALRDELGLEEEALAVTRRLSGAWLASVAERGARALDLSPAFAEEEAPLFWMTNHHLNGAANQIVTSLLFPLLDPFLD